VVAVTAAKTLITLKAMIIHFLLIILNGSSIFHESVVAAAAQHAISQCPGVKFYLYTSPSRLVL
jgi:hypothetical protein